MRCNFHLREQQTYEHICAQAIDRLFRNVALQAYTHSVFHSPLYSTVYLPVPLTLCLQDLCRPCLILLLSLLSLSISFFFWANALSLHLLVPFSFPSLEGLSVSTAGIRDQALNIFYLVMPRGGHHPGFVLLTHWSSPPCYIEARILRIAGVCECCSLSICLYCLLCISS